MSVEMRDSFITRRPRSDKTEAAILDKLERQRFESEFCLPHVRVRIRLAEEPDLDELVWSGGPEARKTHAERLALQDDGDALYFVATIHDVPIAHALLRWEGRPTAPDYPDIAELRVFEALRGFGIGTALIEACEKACRARGYRRIGLAVNPVFNSGTRALYERLGYRFAGTGLYLDGIKPPPEDDTTGGGTILVMEMVKELAPTRGHSADASPTERESAR